MGKNKQSYIKKLHSYYQELYFLAEEDFSGRRLKFIKNGLEKSYQTLKYVGKKKSFPSLTHSKGILLFSFLLLKNGFEVNVEYPITKSVIYDVYARKKNKKIGIEVETNKTDFIKGEKKKRMYPMYRLISKTARYGSSRNVDYFYISYPVFNQPNYWDPRFYTFYNYLTSPTNHDSPQVIDFLWEYALLECRDRKNNKIREGCFNYITDTLAKSVRNAHLDGILLYDSKRNNGYLVVLKKLKKRRLKEILDFEEKLHALV